MQNIFIRNVYKTYQKQTILQDICLDIHTQDFVTLLGPSGCGKTTLLNILGGFVEFDKGEVIIDSKVYTHLLQLSPSRIKVFQNYILLPWKTTLHQIIFGLESKFLAEKKKVSRKEVEEIALYYLNLVGLLEHINKFPHQLSGGQQSRVNIARALSVQPEVLLMDEPFGALDNFTRENLQNELKLIANKLKITCVFVTHDVDEALILGNKIVVMNTDQGNISLKLDIHYPYDKSDSYFYRLKNEIYENLKYPNMKKAANYII